MKNKFIIRRLKSSGESYTPNFCRPKKFKMVLRQCRELNLRFGGNYLPEKIK